MKDKRNKITKNKGGFSMAEMVISASVLIIMTAGIFFALSNSLRHSMDSRNDIIATELAQEGIELVRNVKDNSGTSALTNGAYCKIDKNYVSVSCAETDFKLYYNSNFYDHASSANGTKFFRRIIIESYGSPAVGKKITSVAKWDGADLTDIIPTAANCNVSNKCVFVSAILTER